MQQGDGWTAAPAGGVEGMVRTTVPATVVQALELELVELARRDSRVAGSALALSAVSLARELDDPGVSATAKAACQRALRETIDRLSELAPPVAAGDRLDELESRRSRARGAA